MRLKSARFSAFFYCFGNSPSKLEGVRGARGRVSKLRTPLSCMPCSHRVLCVFFLSKSTKSTKSTRSTRSTRSAKIPYISYISYIPYISYISYFFPRAY